MKTTNEILLALALSTIASHALAQAPLLTGLGGPLDFGTDSPPRSDDDAMPTALGLSATFPGGIDLYGAHYNDVFVNINGSLTFGAGLGTFSPDPFPRPFGVPMLAGWWANVDTRPVPPGAPDTNQIYYASTFEHFVVTWIDVGYFDQHIDHLNAFQIILRPPSSGVLGAADVEFRYHRCEWTTGDDPASGGTGGLGGMPAQAGFDQGDGVHHQLLPGSGTAAVLSLCTLTNGTTPGAWGMTIGGPPSCGNGYVELGEECDDGNPEPHDFCDPFCVATTPCYTSFPDGGRHDPLSDAAVDADVDAAVGPCELPDANLEDAAIVSPDAGRADAGRRPDAGTRFDAGIVPADAGARRDTGPHTSVNELDVTGGGCGCRAGTRASGGAPMVIACLALALARRRRSRSG
jgi:cysteine-rich repeat protein